jgi:hypothetical protein
MSALRHIASQRGHVGEAHPVQGACPNATRNVEIGVGVEVDQPDPFSRCQMPGDGADAYRAVATEHQV